MAKHVIMTVAWNM